jgi:hypothetical protein
LFYCVVSGLQNTLAHIVIWHKSPGEVQMVPVYL